MADPHEFAPMMGSMTWLCLGVFAVLSTMAAGANVAGETVSKAFSLSPQHVGAAMRKRRIVVNHQADGLLYAVRDGVPVEDLMTYEFAFADEAGTHIDAQWWSLDNFFPMKARPIKRPNDPAAGIIGQNMSIIRQWERTGFDIAAEYAKQTKRRGLECFYTYRLNEDSPNWHPAFAETHPDCFVLNEWDKPVYDFTKPAVRDLHVAIFRELAEDYPFDGLEIDFSRGVIFSQAGTQWLNRDAMTDFVRRVRAATLEVAQAQERAVLLAVRVPDSLAGCHFDGLDVRSWVRDNLIDMIVLGVRSFDLDVEAFAGLVGDKPIQILTTLDDHHCTDGYSWPPIEVWRGVVANWWQQGADAIQTFNWGTAPPEVAAATGMHVWGAYGDGTPRIGLYQQAYHELGDPQNLRWADKDFVMQRRGGGGSGGAGVDEWTTPRHSYQNTNMLGQLPAPLDNGGKADALLRLRIADDFTADTARIKSLTLYVLLSDPATGDLPDDQKIEPAPINPFWGIAKLVTSPVRKDVLGGMEVRVNNILMTDARIENGWVVYRPDPRAFAVGENLVGVLVKGRDAGGPVMTVEKVEVRVRYETTGQ